MIKDKILKLLKKEELSTSKIGNKIKRSYYRTLEILKELEKDKKVKSKQKVRGVYWSLK